MFFAVQRIITAFLLPPGIFIFLLLALAVLLYHRRGRVGAVLAGLLGLMLWGVSIAPLSDRFVAPLERSALPLVDPLQGADVIVLLGGGIFDGVPDLSGTSAPTEDMLARIVCTLRLYRQRELPIVVAGGAPPEFLTPESDVVGRFLHDLGIPEDRIILERRSRDTLENAVNVAAICQERGFRRPVVITSAYHVRRARLAFARAGLGVAVIPANFRSGAQRRYGWAAFLPAGEPIETIWRAGREYIGLTYYRLALDLREKETD